MQRELPRKQRSQCPPSRLRDGHRRERAQHADACEGLVVAPRLRSDLRLVDASGARLEDPPIEVDQKLWPMSCRPLT
jgi:hypothetical protein